MNGEPVKIVVRLNEFLETGAFGPVSIGLSRDNLLHLLGLPDATASRFRKDRHPAILKYGDFAFHFLGRDQSRLSGIFLDTFDVPRGNAVLHVDPWCIRYGLPLEEVEYLLAEANIPFRAAILFGGAASGLLVGPGIELAFAHRVG